MRGLYIEQRSLEGTTISRDVAHHLYTRQLPGMVCIVTARPAVMMASISKQWAKVVRHVQRERSSTLNPVRIQELGRALAHMQTLRFATKEFPVSFGTGVFFISPEEAASTLPSCHTMYILEEVDRTQLEQIAAGVLHHGLVVVYW